MLARCPCLCWQTESAYIRYWTMAWVRLGFHTVTESRAHCVSPLPPPLLAVHSPPTTADELSPFAKAAAASEELTFGARPHFLRLLGAGISPPFRRRFHCRLGLRQRIDSGGGASQVMSWSRRYAFPASAFGGSPADGPARSRGKGSSLPWAVALTVASNSR